MTMYKTTFTARVKAETEPKMRQLMGERPAEAFFTELVDSLYEKRMRRNVPAQYRPDMERFHSSLGLVEDAVVDMLNQGEKLLSKAREEARVHAEAQAQEITDLTARAEGLEERIKRLENQILEYQNRVETQSAEAVQVRQDWLEREKGWKEREAQLQEKIERLDASVQTEARKQLTLKDEIGELKAALEESRRATEAAERRLEVQAQSHAAELKAKDLEAERRSLQSEKSAKTGLSAKYEIQIKDLQAKIDQARKEEREIAARAAANAEKKIQGLTSQAEASRAALKSELAALTTQIEDLHKEYGLKMEKARVDERDKAAIREDEIRGSQEKQLADLASENKVLKQRMEALKAKQDELVREHQKAMDGMTRRIEQARQEERAHAHKTLDTFKSRVAEMETQMDKAQETIQALKREKGEVQG